MTFLQMLHTFLVEPYDVDNESNYYDNKDSDHNSYYGAVARTTLVRLNCHNRKHSFSS